MSIRLPEGLPAAATLAAEGVELAAGSASGGGLSVALLNLMPAKAATETQLARLLGGSPFEVELTLFVPDGYSPKCTPAEHMRAFYRPFSELRHRRFDGLIVSGAPVEMLPFEAVSYWRELTRILDWSRENVGASYFICWAAQAALYHFYGVPKRLLAEKRFGVFPHRQAAPGAALLRGFAGEVPIPVSRHSEARAADLPPSAGLETLLDSDEAGLAMLEDAALNAVYMLNHLEYDADTLDREYRRDIVAGKSLALPRHYYPGDDPGRAPTNSWRPHAQLFFTNWLARLERRARRRRDGEAMLSWLLAAPEATPAGADYLVQADGGIDSVPNLLRRLAAEGLSPEAMRTHRRDRDRLLIELRLPGAGDDAAERVARALLQVAEVRKVSYRARPGSGGTWTRPVCARDDAVQAASGSSSSAQTSVSAATSRSIAALS